MLICLSREEEPFVGKDEVLDGACRILRSRSVASNI